MGRDYDHRRADVTSRNLLETYKGMSDDDLLRVALDKDNLADEAKLTLEAELTRRGLGDGAARQYAQDLREREQRSQAESRAEAQGRRRRWLDGAKRLGIFVLGAIVADCVLEYGCGIRDPEALRALSAFTIRIGFAGFGLSLVIGGRWLTVKRTWLLAAALYLGMFVWFAIEARK